LLEPDHGELIFGDLVLSPFFQPFDIDRLQRRNVHKDIGQDSEHMGDYFEVGDFGKQKERLQVFDVFLGLFNKFLVQVFDCFELLIDSHSKQFLFVDNTISILNTFILLLLSLFVVLFFVFSVLFAELLTFVDGFCLEVLFLTWRLLFLSMLFCH
jgi:hypothetical protein